VHAPGDDVLDSGGRDAATGEQLGVARAEQIGGRDDSELPLLSVATADRGSHGFDDDDLTAGLLVHSVRSSTVSLGPRFWTTAVGPDVPL
jgi:hypothetical protein